MIHWVAALTFYIINVIKKFKNPTADCSRATVVERIISLSIECGEPTVNAFRKERHFVSKKKGQSDKKYLRLSMRNVEICRHPPILSLMRGFCIPILYCTVHWNKLMCNNTNLNRCVFKVVNSIATALKVVLAGLARAIYHLDPEGKGFCWHVVQVY